MTEERTATMTVDTARADNGDRRRGVRLRGPGRVAVAAVLAAITALQVQPAAAGTRASAAPAEAPSAEAREYKTAGEPVKGTASSGRAPTLEPGVFTDTIAVGEKKYYGVDLDAVSNAYLSGFALPKTGAKVAYDDGLKLELESTSGTSCGDAPSPTFGTDGAARPIGGYTSRLIDRRLECQEEGHYLFSIERVGDAASDSAPWRLEIRYMVEPPLKKGSVPERYIPAPSSTPAPPTGESKAVRGGTGFNDAAAITSGVWTDRLLPGQTAWYRVPVEWGQRIFAVAEFANAETKNDGYTMNGARMAVYNTARGFVTDEGTTYDGEQAAVQVLTQRADYTNRVESDREQSAMRFSGWYYIAVGLHPGVADFVRSGVDITLRVKLDGQVEKGVEYEGDPAKAGFGISEDAFDGGAGSAAETRRLVAYSAFGVGGLLLLGLVGWFVAARRRGGSAAAVPAGAMAQSPEPYGPYVQPGHGEPHGGGPGGPPAR